MTSNAVLTGEDSNRTCNRVLTAHAQSAEAAKKILINQYAAECSPEIMLINDAKRVLPNLIQKPVILFDSIPDADTLVILRKQLKRVEGVQDVAERWIANGMLAIEINPDQTILSQEDFSRIVQMFANEKTENMVVRMTQKTESGAVFEVVKY